MTVLLKLGGSAITDKSKENTAKPDEISRLSSEIASALSQNPKMPLIVGNGGGSFPHRPAKEGSLKDGVTEAWQKAYVIKTQEAAAKLNLIVVNSLVKNGVLAVPFRPSIAGSAHKGKIGSLNSKALLSYLIAGYVPVVCGDVLIDDRRGCLVASTETVFSFIAKNIPVSRIIIGTNVPGVLDDNGKVIKNISPQNISKIKACLSGSKETDVTGGMLHKVESMLKLASYCDSILITDCTKPGMIEKALNGKTVDGTIISK